MGWDRNVVKTTEHNDKSHYYSGICTLLLNTYFICWSFSTRTYRTC